MARNQLQNSRILWQNRSEVKGLWADAKQMSWNLSFTVYLQCVIEQGTSSLPSSIYLSMKWKSKYLPPGIFTDFFEIMCLPQRKQLILVVVIAVIDVYFKKYHCCLNLYSQSHTSNMGSNRLKDHSIKGKSKGGNGYFLSAPRKLTTSILRRKRRHKLLTILTQRWSCSVKLRLESVSIRLLVSKTRL